MEDEIIFECQSIGKNLLKCKKLPSDKKQSSTQNPSKQEAEKSALPNQK